MVLLPSNSNTENNKTTESKTEPQPQPSAQPTQKKSIKQRSIDRLSNILTIVMKIAKINGYDDIGRIVNEKGEFIPDSDMITLLEYALKSGNF